MGNSQIYRYNVHYYDGNISYSIVAARWPRRRWKWEVHVRRLLRTPARPVQHVAFGCTLGTLFNISMLTTSQKMVEHNAYYGRLKGIYMRRPPFGSSSPSSKAPFHSQGIYYIGNDCCCKRIDRFDLVDLEMCTYFIRNSMTTIYSKPTWVGVADRACWLNNHKITVLLSLTYISDRKATKP